MHHDKSGPCFWNTLKLFKKCIICVLKSERQTYILGIYKCTCSVFFHLQDENGPCFLHILGVIEINSFLGLKSERQTHICRDYTGNMQCIFRIYDKYGPCFLNIQDIILEMCLKYSIMCKANTFLGRVKYQVFQVNYLIYLVILRHFNYKWAENDQLMQVNMLKIAYFSTCLHHNDRDDLHFQSV